MKLAAKNRLELSSTQNITYEEYARVVASINPAYVVAFDFKVPSALKGLWNDLKDIGNLLKESGEVGWEHIVQAFKEKSVFTLLKGVGFSLAKLLKAVKAAAGLPGNALFRALQDLTELIGSSKAFKALKVSERLELLDKVLKKHPVLTKLTGLALAGLLIWMWLHASFTGHVDRDLDLVDAVVDCIRGNFDLKELFTSPDGINSLACLLFGIATGGAGLTSYGFGKVESALSWLGDNSGTVFNLALALFYAGAKKARLHFELKQLPKELHSARSQDWYSRLHPKDRASYRKKYPGTQFHNSERLIPP